MMMGWLGVVLFVIPHFPLIVSRFVMGSRYSLSLLSHMFMDNKIHSHSFYYTVTLLWKEHTYYYC